MSNNAKGGSGSGGGKGGNKNAGGGQGGVAAVDVELSALLAGVFTSTICAALDRMLDLYRTLNLKAPQFIVLGNENNGKSTLLERIAGFPIFPSRETALINSGACTICPIRLILRREEITSCTIKIRNRKTQAERNNQSVPITMISHILKLFNEEMRVKAKNCAVLTGKKAVVFDEEIVVEIRSPMCPFLELLDLPGLSAADESAYDLADEILGEEKDHSLILMVVKDTTINLSNAPKLILKHKLEDKTTGIYTFLDTFETDGSCTADSMIKPLFMPVKGEDSNHFEQVSWMGCVNKKPKDFAGLPEHERLSAQWSALDKNEASIIKERFPKFLQEKNIRGSKGEDLLGVPAIKKHLESKYEKYIYEKWSIGMYTHLIRHFFKLSDRNLCLGFPMIKIEVEEEKRPLGIMTIGETVEALKKIYKEGELFPGYNEEEKRPLGIMTIGETVEALKKICMEGELFPGYNEKNTMLALEDDNAITKIVKSRANVACTDVGWMKIDDCEGTIYTTLADLQRTVLPPGEIDFDKYDEEAQKFENTVMKLLRKEKEQILEFSKSIPAKFVEAVLGSKKVSNSAITPLKDSAENVFSVAFGGKVSNSSKTPLEIAVEKRVDNIFASTFEWNEPDMQERMSNVKKFDISTIPSDLQTSVLQLDLVPGLVTSYRAHIDEQLKKCNKLFESHVEEVLKKLPGNLVYAEDCFLTPRVGAASRKPKVILKFSTKEGQSPHAIGNGLFIHWYRNFRKITASFTEWGVPDWCFKLDLKDENQVNYVAVFEARKKLLVEMLDVSQALKSFKDLQEHYSPGADQYAALYRSLVLDEQRSTLMSSRSILKLFGSKNKMDLLYKASRDGYSAQAFHSKCDNKGATLTIFRTTTGKVAGGYTSKSWNSTSNNFVSVPLGQAFIFSTDGNNVTKYNNNVLIGNSIYCHAGYGPTFGNAHCLRISNNSNTNTSSHSSGNGDGVSFTYGLPSNLALVGSNSFTTNEIEVFQIS